MTDYDKTSLEVLDHAAGVADDLIARALVIVQQVQAGEKSHRKIRMDKKPFL